MKSKNTLMVARVIQESPPVSPEEYCWPPLATAFRLALIAFYLSQIILDIRQFSVLSHLLVLSFSPLNNDQ